MSLIHHVCTCTPSSVHSLVQAADMCLSTCRAPGIGANSGGVARQVWRHRGFQQTKERHAREWLVWGRQGEAESHTP